MPDGPNCPTCGQHVPPPTYEELVEVVYQSNRMYQFMGWDAPDNLEERLRVLREKRDP